MEDIKNNPYYIDNNYPITEHQKQLLKENNIYILTALSSIIKNKGETSSVRPAYKKKILSGKLYNPDNVLGLNTNNLGEKLKALFIALDKEENKKKFCNSYFNIAISLSHQVQYRKLWCWLVKLFTSNNLCPRTQRKDTTTGSIGLL